MKYRAYLKGFRIEEVSIIFTDRIHGKSKMASLTILEFILDLP
ncbi:MAG: polyprenol monophosphomannose synthase, partial [Bacteroidota bacterium]